MKRALFAGAFTVALGLLATLPNAEEVANGFTVAADKSGNIRVPSIDYRAEWRVLGSWIVAGGDEVGGESGASGVHVVYTQPGVIEHYRQTGEFPDGAVLVKELLGAKTSAMTTGVVSYASELEGWFVMIKDRKGRFSENPLWGDGWGWAQFEADDPATTITEDYKSACLQCHVPAKETDWVYVKGYPPLKGPGTKQ